MAYKNRKLDGDLQLDRHMNVGGRLNVSGNANILGNVRVGGWLDAPNIKGAIRGFYPSLAALESAEPNPQLGWMAAVGMETPFTLCLAIRHPSGGVRWMPQPGGGVNIEIDVEQAEAAAELVGSWGEPWQSGVAVRVDTVVEHLGVLYKAVSDITAGQNVKTPSESARWEMVTRKPSVVPFKGVSPVRPTLADETITGECQVYYNRSQGFYAVGHALIGIVQQVTSADFPTKALYYDGEEVRRDCLFVDENGVCWVYGEEGLQHVGEARIGRIEASLSALESATSHSIVEAKAEMQESLAALESVVRLDTPIEVESVEEMERKIAGGYAVDGQIYFVAEEED